MGMLNGEKQAWKDFVPFKGLSAALGVGVGGPASLEDSVSEHTDRDERATFLSILRARASSST